MFVIYIYYIHNTVCEYMHMFFFTHILWTKFKNRIKSILKTSTTMYKKKRKKRKKENTLSITKS